MHIAQECVGCILRQSERVCDAIDASDELRNAIISGATDMSRRFDFRASPPENATPLYEMMSKLAHKADLYAEQKREATHTALTLFDEVKSQVLKSEDIFKASIKAAVAGNVIDLAADVTFDLHEELADVFELAFSIDDSISLHDSVASAKTLLLIGDNAGEHIFDLLFMQIIKKLYPHVRLYYMTRGRYIINDITLQDCMGYGFEEVCELVNSGVSTPGFVYELATPEAKALFDSADCVITKGMGNYECLSETKREVTFLLKVKCSVVADSLGQNIGDIICYSKGASA